MTTPKVDLKNKWLAAVLAFLIPGFGHVYQRRRFKAVIYFTCVLGMFLTGMTLGEWKVVYWRWEPGGHRTFGYLAQVLVGLPALPARFQALRYTAPPLDGFDIERRLRLDTIKGSDVDSDLDLPFTGRFRYRPDPDSFAPEAGDDFPNEPIINVTGRIRWQREDGLFTGSFEGNTEDGKPIKLAIAGQPTVSPRVFAHGEITPTMLREEDTTPARQFSNSLRYVHCDVEDGPRIGEIEGTVERTLMDWFQSPLEDKALEEIHGRLGRRYALAEVITWIAGLLNLLAIWDAFEGPAYGYGDEEETVEEDSVDRK
ncbi:MAG: DUF6677 family protein [Planctomycetota bacterium]|nr:DUF6677 family protein [Planctomycetota bacterium]MEE3285884.1 DUF6677 family protein [Planctomycetota bacterium]